MPDLTILEINGATVIAVEDPRIVAAMKAFNYVWQEEPETEARVELVVRTIEELCARLVEVGTGEQPKTKSG
jgi:hypothetical protein